MYYTKNTPYSQLCSVLSIRRLYMGWHMHLGLRAAQRAPHLRRWQPY